MDYRTKPVSRVVLRKLAKVIKTKIFRCRNKYFFDVIAALEMLPLLFNDVSVEIVDDDDSELKDVPCSTTLDEFNHYVIKIKESIYEEAYRSDNGGYRMHIMHEICHYLLFTIGFKPYFDRTYKNNVLNPYESIEWQAKALAGEILIPFEQTVGLSEKQIMKKCKVSSEAARTRTKMDLNSIHDKSVTKNRVSKAQLL